MINGIHGVIYTKDAEGVRAFFQDTLGFPSVDAGHGWLLFSLPPAELGIHPADKDNHQELWLMCDDITKTVEQLRNKGVQFSGPINNESFGLVTAIKLPGGDELGLFQPEHPTALHLRVRKSPKKRRILSIVVLGFSLSSIYGHLMGVATMYRSGVDLQGMGIYTTICLFCIALWQLLGRNE